MNMFSGNKRQKFLTPWSLYIGQIIYGWFNKLPIITKTQAGIYKPLFIIGSGRSGTTLLRKILLNHPTIDIPSETLGSLPNAIKKFYRYRGADWNDMIGIIGSEFYLRNNFDLWETDIFSNLNAIKNAPKNEQSLALIIDTIYKAHIKKHKPNATLWGDKSPFNTLRLSWLNKAFPNSLYINIIRDGRDVSYSLIKTGLFNTLRESAQRWNESIDCARVFEQKISSYRFLNVKYEDLVANPKEETKGICRFLGLSFSNSMVIGAPEQMSDIHFYDHYSNVQNEINDKSIGKWKELHQEDQDLLNKLLLKNLKRYKYLR